MSDTPTRGQTAYIVDENGGTFAFADAHTAAKFEASERASGASGVETFTVTVPEDGMTWFDVAEHACVNGAGT